MHPSASLTAVYGRLNIDLVGRAGARHRRESSHIHHHGRNQTAVFADVFADRNSMADQGSKRPDLRCRLCTCCPAARLAQAHWLHMVGTKRPERAVTAPPAGVSACPSPWPPSPNQLSCGRPPIPDLVPRAPTAALTGGQFSHQPLRKALITPVTATRLPKFPTVAPRGLLQSMCESLRGGR